MTVTRLAERWVEKPWGRVDLPACFGRAAGDHAPVGEICFEDPSVPDRQLLVKYLFTSERLSIQVHPGKKAAIAAGHSDGKDEAWLVLQAEAGATIGLGLSRNSSPTALREAALDGSIVDLVEWRLAAAGDFYYSPAGTIHALGAGLTVIEIQQNVDATYRLYDYGRPRELHLDEAIAVARLGPFEATNECREIGSGRIALNEGPAFVVEHWTGELEGTIGAERSLPVWIIPVAGSGLLDGEPLSLGGVWIADGSQEFSLGEDGEALIAYRGSECRSNLID